MTKIEEILDLNASEPYWKDDVLNAMKEYAKFCMKELCSDLQLHGHLYEDYPVNSLIQKILMQR